MLTLMVWIGLACGGSLSTAPDGPHGEVPAAGIVAPAFAAVSHTGAPRSRADLLGHPTVVWFFPAAGTPG